jgi:hypothetical protein
MVRLCCVHAWNTVVQLATNTTMEARMTEQAASRREPAQPALAGDMGLPFCGDEYPPLKASPGTVVCTKPAHPETERHLNEETGWVWWTDQ